jgi:effector-binding domain-containing protein
VEHTVRLERRSGQPLAVVRRRAAPAELSRVVPEACGVVWNALRAQGVTGAGRHVAVYLDGEINLEVGVELDAPFAGGGEVVSSATPAGDVACVTHHGPYGQLHAAHEAVRRWCASHGRTPAGPSWEVYGHWQDEWNRDPSRITTEVCYLLGEPEA